MAAVRIPIEEDASWKQRCNARLERLKNDFSAGGEDEDEFTLRGDFLAEKIYMDFRIYKAIEVGDPIKFVDKVAEVCGERKLLLSEIFDQVIHGGDSLLHVAAKHGKEKIAELIACHFPSALEAKNIRGDTALHEAARLNEGGSNVIKVILSHTDARKKKEDEFRTRWTRFVDEGGSNVLERGSDIIKEILPKIDGRKTKEDEYIEKLKKCVKESRSNVIKVIPDARETKEDKDITRRKNCVGNTALHEAVAHGNVDGVTELFRIDKAVKHELNNANKSPLYLAVYNYMRLNNNVKSSQQKEKNAKAIVDCLLQDSLRADRPDPPKPWCGGHFPLHAAIGAVSDKRREQSFMSNILRRLPGCRMFNFARSITKTASSPKARLEELVRRRPEMIFLKDEHGRTPLHFAALSGYLHGVCIILKRYPLAALEPDIYGDLPIHLACKSGEVEVVKKLILEQECPYVEGLLNQKSQNILHIAAMEGKHDVVKYILTSKDIKINFDERDKDGNTPLHVASANMYPKVLFYLTKYGKADLQSQNKKGLTARDVIFQQSPRPRTYRELLSHAILHSANASCAETGSTELRPHHDINRMKDLANTLMLVAILIATVTFAAGFTVPGSVYASDDPNPQQRGTAVLAKRPVFQAFMIFNTVAMYSSTVGSFILLWAQLGDLHLASSSFNFAFCMVALALTTMSGAFIAAAYLVVQNVRWLAFLIIAIGAVSILFIVVASILFAFPFGSHNPLWRPLSNPVIWILIPFAGSYESPQKKKPETSSSQDGSTDKNK